MTLDNPLIHQHATQNAKLRTTPSVWIAFLADSLSLFGSQAWDQDECDYDLPRGQSDRILTVKNVKMRDCIGCFNSLQGGRPTTLCIVPFSNTDRKTCQVAATRHCQVDWACRRSSWAFDQRKGKLSTAQRSQQVCDQSPVSFLHWCILHWEFATFLGALRPKNQ